MAAVTAEPGRWGVRWRPLAKPRMRLFCLPHSGGGAAVYRPWAGLLPPGVELVSVRLPGREARFREPPFSRLDDLVPVLLDNLLPLLKLPHSWFGHSMGALVAFEACREIRRRGLPEPARLLISSRPAPHLTARDEPISGVPDEELTALVTALNGTPSEVHTRTTAFAKFIPTLRADFSVIETYRYRSEPPLDMPISVFGGEQDPAVSVDELRAWRIHSTIGCDVQTFRGDHFYLHQDPDKFVAALAAGLMI